MVYDREMGSMKTLMISPFPRWYLLLCKLMAGVAVSIVQVYMFLAVVEVGDLLNFWDVEVPPLGYLEMLPAMILAGLMLGALGLDLLTASPTRFGITLVLNWLLHVKMDNEEKALLELYGEEYERYQVRPLCLCELRIAPSHRPSQMATPRLFPPVPLLTPLLRAAVGQAADMVDAKVATDGDGVRRGHVRSPASWSPGAAGQATSGRS